MRSRDEAFTYRHRSVKNKGFSHTTIWTKTTEEQSRVSYLDPIRPCADLSTHRSDTAVHPVGDFCSHYTFNAVAIRVKLVLRTWQSYISTAEGYADQAESHCTITSSGDNRTVGSKVSWTRDDRTGT